MRALVEQLRASPARLGTVRLVCVDGPAGSGKTTYAGRLAAALGPGAAVLHMDDLYAGWTLTGAVARLCAGVLRPAAEGRNGAVRPYDWTTLRFSTETVLIPPRPVLIVEGCGSGSRVLDPVRNLLVWVEAPAALRLARGLARDGADLEPEWRRWQETEAAEFARENTRARADLRIDGTAAEEGT